MKHRLIDFTQVAFWLCQEAENEFAVPSDHLIHHSLDLKQVALFFGQETEN